MLEPKATARHTSTLRKAAIRQAHNLKVIGSNPILATTFIITRSPSRSDRRDGFTFSEERNGPDDGAGSSYGRRDQVHRE
jgi:hypothetical protein